MPFEAGTLYPQCMKESSASASFSGSGNPFSSYVAARKRSALGGDHGAPYAYGPDLAMLQRFRRMRPVEMAAASTVRMYKDVLKHQLLGKTIRAGERQFPSLYGIARQCAEILDVPVPNVYVTNSPVLNAYTFGTDDDAVIVIHSALIDHYSDAELAFVIGHETGHIQNKHVVYGTVLRLMQQTAGLFLKWLMPPAEMALMTWYRRAEITCDRAGLLCVKDIDVATKSLLKLACGSLKLYEELDVEAYLEQLEEGRHGVGRLGELFDSHPYLSKRIAALQVFERSEVYRKAVGGEDALGLSLSAVDDMTSEIIQVVRG